MLRELSDNERVEAWWTGGRFDSPRTIGGITAEVAEASWDRATPCILISLNIYLTTVCFLVSLTTSSVLDSNVTASFRKFDNPWDYPHKGVVIWQIGHHIIQVADHL
jgi:hypothetical protein